MFFSFALYWVKFAETGKMLKLNDRIPDKWLSHIRFMGEALLTGVNDWERRKTEERLENGKNNEMIQNCFSAVV